ncbi:hypothetical protein [Alicyclobacillus sp. ALC3]|uniref:hypothetical protein n=1 Tax=Alicyclobacillus sp. ALC3 TaxID=2796143 RepID=UPI0023791DBB|nr:hypothetical protein [Alicyclobacillus sp. ALC3]WDL98534.1 hypothetical protein JC200_07610 [Alicyclobacillus sp. ALC3]
MDVYHSWIYVYILNTTWMVRAILYATFALNILSPILVWFIFRGQKVLGKGGLINGVIKTVIDRKGAQQPSPTQK